MSRRLMLGAALGSAGTVVLANAPLSSLRPTPRQQIARVETPIPAAADLVAQAGLSGETSYVVMDLKTGAVLESANAAALMPPASVTKAVTALYALEKLGPNFRFRTRLIADGVVSGGTLRGDLILAGGGDPTLDTDALGDMAAALKQAGVRKVTGKFLIHRGPLPHLNAIDPGQPDQVSYNPAVSGLNLNFNRVHFEWKREAGTYAVKMDARARKYRPEVDIARMRVVNRDGPIYTYDDKGGQDRWTVARGALGKGGARWLPVRKPELYAAEVFQTLARAQGITLPKAQIMTVRPRGTVLVNHRSRPLNDILQAMLRFSTNLTAEVVGLMATAATGGKPATLQASAKEMTTWVRRSLGAKTAKFVDHSGLGDQSRIAAGEMAEIMVRVNRSTDLLGILKDIKLRDDKGKPINNHPIQIRAKTGTLNFVSGLSGYMNSGTGRQLAFAIFSSDIPRRAQITKADGDVPPGTVAWTRRARRLQLRLIERWGAAYKA